MEQPDAAQTGEQAALIFSGQLMLPQTEDAPAGAAQGAGDETVAGLVLGNLGLPELRVLFGLRGVDRAAVRLGRFRKTAACVVDDGAVRQQGYGDEVFIHPNRIGEIALAVQELFETNHYEVRNFALGLSFGGENAWLIFVFGDC